ncbi:MAG: metalloregulator ArsR/SmtB family transcription factor [Actinomycetota bacterium]|nr:metalloregulator ArsR/SmtB family transcription factor [Actinomycetota bacterium]
MLNGSPEMDRLFQALADPSRRAMVERLVGGPESVSRLAEPLPMSLPAVVQHLRVLEDAGLISSEKVGRVRTCRLAPEVLRRAESWIASQRTAWERRLDRLAEELAVAVEPANPTTPPTPPPKGSR